MCSQTSGCTDVLATNYNPNANMNDGNCEYTQATVNPKDSWLLPPLLNETSGLILWNNKIWTHNDDTDINLYEIDINAIDEFVTHSLVATKNVDWEEVSQDESYVYVGDFGNNANGNRTDLKILRINKSSILNNNPVIDTIAFSYSSQTDFTPKGSNNTNFDCEAFIVTKNNIYLFTKEWVSNTTTVYSLPKTPGTYEAQNVSGYNVNGLITGATYLEDKRLIVLSGYSILLQPFLFLLYDFQNYDFFEGNKRKVTLDLPFHQVEGIATENGFDYFVSNERFSFSNITTEAKIHSVDLSVFFENYLEKLSVDSPMLGSIENIDIYPNPVSEVLNFKLDMSNSSTLEMFIYNTIGQNLGTYYIESDLFQIDVSDFRPGVYYFNILKENKNLVMKGKFVVK